MLLGENQRSQHCSYSLEYADGHLTRKCPEIQILSSLSCSSWCLPDQDSTWNITDDSEN